MKKLNRLAHKHILSDIQFLLPQSAYNLGGPDL